MANIGARPAEAAVGASPVGSAAPTGRRLAVADAAVRRFCADLACLWPAAVDPLPVDSPAAAPWSADGPDLPPAILLAVSGGPDSVAMLLLANTAFPGRIQAATVDHGLRADAADEAAAVGRLCAQIGVDHAVLGCIVAAGSLQANARAARYAALSGWATALGGGLLLTAHHADDQAETFLMRAARGAGVAGLAAIRPRRRLVAAGAGSHQPAVWLVRPLLGWRRAELRALVDAAGVTVADDPANRDPRHDRTRFRALIEEQAARPVPLLTAPALAAAARHLGEVDETLAVVTDLFWDIRVQPDDAPALTIDMTALPREIVRRLVRRGLQQVRSGAEIARPRFDDATNIEALLDALAAGFASTQAGILVTPQGSRWHFAPAPARRPVSGASG